MTRRILFLSILVIGRLAYGQAAPDLNKEVSYTTAAVPLRVAVESLSRSSGLELKVASDLQEEPIILRFDEVPLQTAMDKIAGVLGAKWTATKEGFLLERTQAMTAALENEDRQRRLEKISKSIQTIVQQAKSDGRMTKERAADMADYLVHMTDQAQTGQPMVFNPQAAEAVATRTAEMRMLAELLSSMDPAEIASLKPGGRYVYAAKPNTMQRQLPSVDEAMMQRYMEDQNMVSDAVIDKLKTLGRTITDDVTLDYPHLTDPAMRVFVAFEPDRFSDDVSCDFKILAANGDLVGEAHADLGRDRSWYDYEKAFKASKIETVKSSIEASPALKEIVSRSGYGSPAASKQLPLDPDVLAALLSPTTHDPLSFATSECVLKVAEAEGSNVVFLGTDECELVATQACVNGKISKDLLLTAFHGQEDMDVSDSDGWFIGKPVSPLRAEGQRCPREALEIYLGSVNEKGYASIEDQCALALATPPGVTERSVWQWSGRIWPEMNSSQSGPESRLRIYGGLSDADRQAAKTGLTISVSKLPSDQLEDLNDFFFSGYTYVQSTAESRRQQDGDEPYRAVTNEKTLAAPDGILASDEITFKESLQDQVFYNVSTGQGSYPSSCALEDLAMQFAQFERPDLFPYMKNMSYTNLRLGSQRAVNITVTLRHKYSVLETIAENHPAAADGVSTTQFADSLPADLKTKFEDALAKARKMWKDMNPADFGGGQPPVAPPMRSTQFRD